VAFSLNQDQDSADGRSLQTELQAQGLPITVLSQGQDFTDTDGLLAQSAGVSQGGMALVRPDAHRALTGHACAATLSRLCQRRLQHQTVCTAVANEAAVGSPTDSAQAQLLRHGMAHLRHAAA
jgi:hypothetical protein